MSDDIWRRRDDAEAENTWGTDFGADFGTVQFADDPTSEPAISFSGSDTGLPHWSEPPTGEIPRPAAVADDDDTDVWATFHEPSEPTGRPERLVIGGDTTGGHRTAATGESHRDPSREVITDITGGTTRPGARGPQVRRGSTRGAHRTVARDMPTAVTTGLALIAAFLGAIMWRPAAVMLIVVAVVGLAAVEFFSKVTEKGYRPATFAGLTACVSAPLAAYWIGDGAVPLVIAFAFLATSIGFVGAPGVQAGPMPNVAITNMAVAWIGLLGSYAALILRESVAGGAGAHAGTDTLFIIVAAVVANDVGALFVGSAAGRTPLRTWVSPNKSVEGLLGGTVATLVVCALVASRSGTWDSAGEWLVLAVVVSVMAPLGDLVESMFKRNLDVKDFGTIVAGHGGVLDRFDGFLFVLPSAYYAMLVLQPWAS